MTDTPASSPVTYCQKCGRETKPHRRCICWNPSPVAEIERLRSFHISFNVALHRIADVDGRLPACGGPDCRICEQVSQNPAVRQLLAALAQGADEQRRLAAQVEHVIRCASHQENARLRAALQEVSQQLKAMARDCRVCSAIPCQKDNSWHADDYENLASQLDTLVSPVKTL